MKVHCFVCIVCLIFLSLGTVSCNMTSASIVPALSEVEKCIETHPDSALILLKKIRPETLHGKAKADYALLMTQAMDKNYIKPSSDSLISLAIEYYVSEEYNSLAKGKTYFYYGRVMQELGRQEEALKAYLKAKAVLENSQEYKMLGLISEEIGMLNREQDIYKEALINFKSALHFYAQAEDSFCVTSAYRNIARVYLFENEWDSAYVYYDKALQIAASKEYNLEASILQELGVLHRSKGDLPKAESFFMMSVQKEKDQDKQFLQYLSLGVLHFKMGKYDSARKYLYLSSESSSLSTRMDAYYYLYQLEKDQNNFYAAICYIEKSDSIKNITYNIETRQLIADMQKKYENEKLEKRNLQMSVDFGRVLLVGSVVFFVVAFFMCYYFYKYKSDRKRIQEIEQTIEDNKELIDQYQHEIVAIKKDKDDTVEDNHNKIGELNGKIMLLTAQNKNLSKHLKELGGEALKSDPISANHMAAFRFLLAFKCGVIKEKLSNEDWDKLFNLFDFFYSNFVNRLQTEYPILTKHDLEICCLLKSGFTHEELSRIFITTSDSVTKAKGRLKRRLGMSAQDDLEFFLRNY